MTSRIFHVTVVAAGICVAAIAHSQAADTPEVPWHHPPAGESQGTSPGKESSAKPQGIEATIINPYRSANMCSQVAGIIKSVEFQEGDFMEQGQVVVRLDDGRYRDLADKAKEKLTELELELEKAEQDRVTEEKLFEQKVTTRQQMSKLKTDAEILKARLREAQKELDLATKDLVACEIKAPFSGYMAVRYKQPYEAADRLESLFSIVDTSKVYAVANVEEQLRDKFTKGCQVTFIQNAGRKFTGIIQRTGILIDPKSKTKKVYCLIENPNSELEVGMTGSLAGGH